MTATFTTQRRLLVVLPPGSAGWRARHVVDVLSLSDRNEYLVDVACPRGSNVWNELYSATDAKREYLRWSSVDSDRVLPPSDNRPRQGKATPMRVMVTGAAGFIGSHLAERLVADGHEVIGVDCFTDYYDPVRKQGNAKRVMRAGAAIHPLDLRTDDITPVLEGVDAVVHAAAMPGLVRSWADLQSYSDCNVVGTGRLIQACTDTGVARLVHLSTSSVYGRLATGDEHSALRPASPYGVTKLAAENLLWAYVDQGGPPVTILRLFSVYGPRQRPDMAYSCFIDALLHGRPLTVYGDGTQTRSVTFVADCVEAVARALTADAAGEVINIGGGEVISVLEVIAILGELLGVEPRVVHQSRRAGDQLHTRADTTKAERLLAWQPTTRPRAGLEAQVAWWRLEAERPDTASSGG